MKVNKRAKNRRFIPSFIQIEELLKSLVQKNVHNALFSHCVVFQNSDNINSSHPSKILDKQAYQSFSRK